MATTMRSVDTRFWIDGWVRKLNALDRYVFLYFLTNPHSSWCGVYEVDIGMVSYETGIEEKELINVILPRLEPKVRYLDGWVYIPNFERYHANHSEKTKKGIENAWKTVPERIRLKIKDLYPIEGVSASASASASTYLSDKSESIKNKKKPMSFKNMRRYKGEEGGYDEEAVQTDPDFKPKGSKAKKVSDDVQAVFDLFQNPASALWRMRELERVAAQVLCEKYGLETLKIRIDRINKEKGNKDPHFPLITTPSQLLDKMPNVERYFGI